MTTYSLSGYVVAVWQRTLKTVLVEGPTDKRLLDRLHLERCLSSGAALTCEVDQASIVSDPSLAQLGNKQRVLTIAGKLSILPAAEEKFNYLVDREWDGVVLSPIPQSYSVLPSSPKGYFTKGHSIENYSFDSGLLADFLKLSFPGLLTPAFFQLLHTRFAEILRLAVAVSLVARTNQLITRCDGLFRSADVEWAGGKYELNANATAKLAARGCIVDIAAESAVELARPDLAGCPVDTLRWLSHGHIGEQIIRSCAAHLAREQGSTPDTVINVETGRRQEKLLLDADAIARWAGNHIEPLDELMSWAA